MPFTQDNRLISIHTPLGDNALLLQGFSGTEGVSQLFTFTLDMLSEQSGLSYDKIVGKSASVRITMSDGEPRYFNGFISRFSQGGRDDALYHYRAQLVPWLWFLTRTASSRIFQKMSVPDIIKKIFDERGFSNNCKTALQGSYEALEYCVQYR